MLKWTFLTLVVDKFSPHDEWKGVGVSSTLVVDPQTNQSCVGTSDIVHNPLCFGFFKESLVLIFLRKKNKSTLIQKIEQLLVFSEESTNCWQFFH
jgi:hypothetical protein